MKKIKYFQLKILMDSGQWSSNCEKISKKVPIAQSP
jgi:hypothetical protein